MEHHLHQEDLSWRDSPQALVVAALAILLLVTVGCSPAGPETLLVTTDCVYSGPRSVEAGSVRLTLNREGLGETAALVVELSEGHSYSELVDHFETGTRPWDERPDWVTSKAMVNIDDITSSDTTLLGMEAGSYAVICVRYWDGERAQPVAPLEVTPAA